MAAGKKYPEQVYIEEEKNENIWKAIMMEMLTNNINRRELTSGGRSRWRKT